MLPQSYKNLYNLAYYNFYLKTNKFITTKVVEYIEFGGALYSGAALFHNQHQFFSAGFKEVDDEELRRENEAALAESLSWAKEDFIKSLWLKSAELNAYVWSLDPPSSTDLLLKSSQGYFVVFIHDYHINGESYCIAAVSYNSSPLIALYHRTVPLDELDEVLATFKTKIHLEISAHESSLKPDVAVLLEPIPSISPKSAPGAPKSKLKRRRNNSRHIQACNMIGDINERVTRSRRRV